MILYAGTGCYSCTRVPYRYPYHGTRAEDRRCPSQGPNAYGDIIRCVLLKGHGADHATTCPSYAPPSDCSVSTCVLLVAVRASRSGPCHPQR